MNSMLFLNNVVKGSGGKAREAFGMRPTFTVGRSDKR